MYMHPEGTCRRLHWKSGHKVMEGASSSGFKSRSSAGRGFGGWKPKSSTATKPEKLPRKSELKGEPNMEAFNWSIIDLNLPKLAKKHVAKKCILHFHHSQLSIFAWTQPQLHDSIPPIFGNRVTRTWHRRAQFPRFESVVLVATWLENKGNRQPISCTPGEFF